MDYKIGDQVEFMSGEEKISGKIIGVQKYSYNGNTSYSYMIKVKGAKIFIVSAKKLLPAKEETDYQKLYFEQMKINSSLQQEKMTAEKRAEDVKKDLDGVYEKWQNAESQRVKTVKELNALKTKLKQLKPFIEDNFSAPDDSLEDAAFVEGMKYVTDVLIGDVD